MGNLISIKNYPVPHGQGNGGGGGVTYVTYNGTSSSGGSGGGSNVSYIMSADGLITRIEGNELNYRYGYIDELQSDIISTRELFADDIDAENITTSKLTADEIDSNKIKTKDLDAVKAYINSLDSYEITTEYLTVTKQAHFFELIIDKVRAVGGQIILTPAQAAIDKVYAYNSNNQLVADPLTNFDQVHHFDVYWRAQDYTGRGTSNDWLVNDQAYCQSFNITEPGVYHDIANKYYWRLVTGVLEDKMVNFTTGYMRNVGDVNTQTNNIWIGLKHTKYQGAINNISWNAGVQIQYGGVTWNNIGSTDSYAVTGIMKTASTTLGIQILPTGDYADRLTDELSFHIYNSDGAVKQPNINIGIYFKDGTSLYFSNVEVDDNFNVTLSLGEPDTQIEAIVINCSQSVQWFQCHGIRLSNESDKMDRVLYPQASIPEPGDNLVQLGYRGNDDNDRRSAIIISAYKTPDTDLKSPSYAQYMGINDFNLKSHRGSYIDARGAKFVGDAGDATVGGTSLTELKIEQGRISQRVTDNKKDADDHFVQVETQIVQTAEEITATAARTYETKTDAQTSYTNLSSQISITAEQIRSDVSATYETKTNASTNYNALSSSITQTATQIRSDVAATYETKTNAEKTKKELSSSITQTATQIRSEVSSTYETRSNAGRQYESLSSSITQTANAISTEVTNRTNADNSLSNRINGVSDAVNNEANLRAQGYNDLSSRITQTSNSISAEVTARKDADNSLSSRINALPDSISATVYSNINGKLTSTGINITNGTILLKANKVTFADSNGNNTDKIRIDTSNGTLIAVNATLSGTLTIKQNNKDGLRLDSNGNIQRWNGSTWVNLFAQRNVRYVTSNTTLNDLDDIVLVGGNGATIYLPTNPTNGRQVTIRNIGSRKWCRINAGSKSLNIGGSDTDHGWNWADLNNDDRAEFIYYSNTWYWNCYGT